MVDVEKPPIPETRGSWIKSQPNGNRGESRESRVPTDRYEKRLKDKLKLTVSFINTNLYSHSGWYFVLLIWTASVGLSAISTLLPLDKSVGESYIGKYLLRIIVCGFWDFNVCTLVLLLTVSFTGVSLHLPLVGNRIPKLNLKNRYSRVALFMLLSVTFGTCLLMVVVL